MNTAVAKRSLGVYRLVLVEHAIVPKAGTIVDLAEKRARSEASKRVLAVEHTMALEDQATET